MKRVLKTLSFLFAFMFALILVACGKSRVQPKPWKKN